jgi:hypothetical protein
VHRFRGVRAETLRRVIPSAEKVVLATATLSDLELSDVLPADDATVVEWQRERMVDHDGRPFASVPRPLVHEVCFTISPAELSLSDTVGALFRIFEDGTPQQGWIADSLRRSLESSPAALDRALQRFAEGFEAQDGMDAPLEAPEEEMPAEGLARRADRATDEEAAEVARGALRAVEEIRGDSKLNALIGLLSHLNEVKETSRRVCVLTEYLATLYYLAAEIEGRGMTCHLIHGGMATEARERSLTMFSQAGAILVATRAVMTGGLALEDVSDLVLYDIPNSTIALQQVLGRFDRFGRKSQLNVHVLVPSNSTNHLFSEALRLLREVLKFTTSAQLTH